MDTFITANQPNQLPSKHMVTDDVVDDELYFDEWPAVPGLVGEIAYFIYRSAKRPIPEVAIGAALAFMAGICGRACNVSDDLGLNHYIVILAPTGEGKNAAQSGIGMLTQAVRAKLLHIPGLYNLRLGPEGIPSAPGLLRAIAGEDGQKCCLSIIGECAHFLKRLYAPNAPDYMVQLRGLMLELFTKSGAKRELGFSAYADKKNNIETVVAPSWSFMGESTVTRFYDAVNELAVHEGFLTRVTILENDKISLEDDNEDRLLTVPEELINKIVRLVVTIQDMERGQDNAETYNWYKIPLDNTEYKNAKEYLRIIHKDIREKRLKYNNLGKETHVAIYSRLEEKILRTAGLLAIGTAFNVAAHEPVFEPTVKFAELEWAEELHTRSAKILMHKFDTGQVGEANMQIEQEKAFVRCIENYGKRDASEWTPQFETQYGVTQEQFKVKIVSRNYLNKLLSGNRWFRDSGDKDKALHNHIRSFVDNGRLVPAYNEDAKSGHYGKYWYVIPEGSKVATMKKPTFDFMQGS